MGILLGFVPFIVFALVSAVSVSLALWLGFTAAFVITIRDFVESPTLRLLDAGSVILLGGLALFAGFIEPSISRPTIRLVAESGFALLALISLVLRRPLSLAYGHEHITEEVWNTPAFVRTNYVITLAWLFAFVAMALADAAMTFNPQMAMSLDLAIGLAALGLAVIFTVRYPARLQRRAARSGPTGHPLRHP